VNLTLPNNWSPRPYQMAMWEHMERQTSEMKARDYEGLGARAACVWHRRAGKDLCMIHFCATQAFQRVGMYWHILPTYRQGRNIVWNGKTRDGVPFLDAFPGSADPSLKSGVDRKRDDEMMLWLPNGSTYQVVGADEPDRLVGANPIGVIFSEWSIMNPSVWELISPILAENGGWAVFIYTPRGRNHGFKTLKSAMELPEWFGQKLTVDDTHAVSADVIQSERDRGMPEEMIEQEYWCSFDAPLVGSYYSAEMGRMTSDDRICKVPWESDLPVLTGWDLGIGDATSIWFYQMVAREVRFIDYYESSGVGLDHYAKVLAEKPYTYGDHIGPHDVQVRELGTGHSRLESLRNLGIRMRVAAKLSVDDGISATRNLLNRSYIDENKCARGIDALRQYSKEEIQGLTGPNGEKLYRDKPKHDWTSHAADALRVIGVGIRPPKKKYDRLAPHLAIV